MPLSEAVADLFLHMLSVAKAPRVRTLCEFAEQVIVVADGPFIAARSSSLRFPSIRLALQYASKSASLTRGFAVPFPGPEVGTKPT